MICDRIVLGCPDSRLQERLLCEPELTLAKALDICRSAEVTKEQLCDIAGMLVPHRFIKFSQLMPSVHLHESLATLAYIIGEWKCEHSTHSVVTAVRIIHQNHAQRTAEPAELAKVCCTTRSQSSNRLYRSQAPDHNTSTA